MKKSQPGNKKCKFYDKGCRIVCNKWEYTSHANSCDFNPDLHSLCDLLFSPCKFKPGCFSKAEVVFHLETKHQLPLHRTSPGSWCFIPEMSFLTDLLNKKKSQSCILFGCTGCTDSNDRPLFLLVGKRNETVNSLSLAVVLVWFDPEGTDGGSYDVEFTLQIGSSFISSKRYLPFPIIMKSKVWSVKEAQLILKTGALNIPISMLEETQFGSQGGDTLLALIRSAGIEKGPSQYVFSRRGGADLVQSSSSN
ncbi:hypothetical protein Ocin01_16401 [Orchesella cincta]|uniref:Uncharacterized protein n=1 Tax=Orchesella cincta TaxID=48709 RepID=A0A1D2MBL7_ORCCI|nr:hypothetical protein Ocin01_16401 [Orchesella cincta]